MLPKATTALSTRDQGFTVIELMVVVAIVAILAALAAPSLRSFVVRNTFASIGNEFSGSILRARNEAVTKNICVTMCMSDTVDATSPFCKQSEDRDWQVGWLVFINPTCDTDYGKDAGSHAISAADMLLIRRPANPNYWLMSQGTNPIRKIMFNSRGNTSLGSAGEFDLAYQATGNQLTLDYGFNICLDKLGRTRSIPAASSCGTY